MNLYKLLFAFTATFVTCSANAVDPDICEIRSAVMGSIAQERDNGVSRGKVKKQLPKEFAALSGWIDVVYDKTKGMTPTQVAELTKISCLKE